MPVDELIEQPEAIEPVEGAEPVEPNEGAEPVEGAEELAEVGGEKRDMRKLPGYIRELKGVNREAYKDAVARYWRDVDTQKLTEGFDLKGTRSWLEEKGGREAFEMTVSELQQAKQEYDGLLEAVQAGDGSIASRLMEQAGENATPIATAVLNEWAKADPEAYRSTLAGVFDGAIASSPLPGGFDRVGMYMEMLAGTLSDPNVPANIQLQQVNSLMGRVQAEFKNMQPFLTSFRQQPTQQVAQSGAHKADPKMDAGRMEVENGRTEIYNTKVKDQVDSFRQSEITRHLKALPGFKNASEEDIQDAVRATIRDVEDQMKADTAFQKSLGGYDAKRDITGKVKLVQSREGKAIEQIAPKWGRKLFGNGTGPQVVKKEPVQQQQPTRNAFQRPAQQQTRSQILRAALAE